MKDDILMTLFGGGTLDYEMLDKCNYDFEDILDMIKGFTTIDEMDFDDILIGAIDVYKNNIQNAIDNKIKELEDDIKYLEHRLDYVGYGKSDLYEIEGKKQDLEKLNTIYANDDIEYFTNYLDTHIFINDEETRKIYKEFLSKEIDEENEKIGFVELDLED